MGFWAEIMPFVLIIVLMLWLVDSFIGCIYGH